MKVQDSARELVILLGGGLDSTTLIPFYQSRGTPVRGVHFDYGQSSLPGERQATEQLCQHYSVPLETVDLGFALGCDNGEYAGRNALLLLAAASLTTPARSVALGIHAGVPYYDSTARFVEDMRQLFDGYFGGRATVEAPFENFIKSEIFAFAVDRGVPIELTFSCERGPHDPCGQCPSCKDREVLLGRV